MSRAVVAPFPPSQADLGFGAALGCRFGFLSSSPTLADAEHPAALPEASPTRSFRNHFCHSFVIFGSPFQLRETPLGFRTPHCRPQTTPEPLGWVWASPRSGFAGIKTQQIQLLGGAEGFGSEDLGVFIHNKIPARTRSHHLGQGMELGGLVVALVSPPCSIPNSPGLPELWEFPAPGAGMCCRLRENKRILGRDFGAVLAARRALGSCGCSLGCASFAQPTGWGKHTNPTLKIPRTDPQTRGTSAGRIPKT